MLTGWAKHPGSGREVLVRLPARRQTEHVHVLNIALAPRDRRSNTYDRAIDAAIFCLNRGRILGLERQRLKLTERAWKLHKDAEALRACARGWRTR